MIKISEDLSIFKKFTSEAQAIELKELLEENGIKSVLADNIPPVDVTFSGNTLEHQYEIRIKQSDFKKAEKFLEKQAENLIDEVDKDYYLFEFSDEELYDILLKSDEWNEFDYTLAQKILTQRGKSVDKDLLNSLKKQRLEQLAKPEESQKAWIMADYIFAVLGGLLGILIGYFLWTAKKTLPNGQKVFSYSDKDRKQGKVIFIIALVIFPVSLILRAFGGI
ncbi:hypothetical protein [Croceivirga radicis]|uniref:hypothetical protein n=1 Tax=Croceivirga radicis TaxID=1929488 RepID=UPI000255B29B|nr:hypothetical protein [Croceivirga radicis]